MQTTVNIRKAAAPHTQVTQTKSWGQPCKWGSIQSTDGGSNIEFGQRSELVKNEKDEYGFRAMSPFKAMSHTRVQPSGSSRMFNSSILCQPYKLSTGYPGGMERNFKHMFDKSTALGEQNPKLLAMRAEAGLKQQDINVLQFATFLPSTLRNIMENYKKLDSLLDIAHDKRKLMRRFKGTEWKSLYLQWLFVWNQLHRDIVGGARFLKKQSRPIGSLVTGRARANWTTSYEDYAFPYAWDQIGKAVCKTNVEVSQRAVSVARVTCDVSYTYNALGIDNPMYLMWDLLRWSWVIDQVLDIGLFIQSITSLHGLKFLGTSVTRRMVNYSTVEVMPHTVKGPYSTSSWEPEYDPGMNIVKTVDRLVYEQPTNDIVFRNPFQNSVAVTAAVAAAVGLKMQRDIDFERIIRHARG